MQILIYLLIKINVEIKLVIKRASTFNVSMNRIKDGALLIKGKKII